MASPLPTVNAVLNAISTIFLTTGFILIKRRNIYFHKRFMLAALISSALFLISYLVYHYRVGSVPYPYYDWTRPVYFGILIPHVVLAAVMVPFILAVVYFALSERFDRHRRLARRVWPVWVFVSVSGIAVYLMLYVF
jgi:putative membrane protein